MEDRRDPAKLTGRDVRSPETDAWPLSRLFFFYASPLFRRAASLTKEGKALEQNDLLPMPIIDYSTSIRPKFEKSWKRGQGDTVPKTTPSGLDNAENAQSTARIRQAILASVGRRFYVAGVIKFFNTVLQFAFPLLLNAILEFIEQTQSGEITEEDPNYIRYRGYWLSALLFVAMASKALSESAYFYRIARASYQSRVAVSVAVYNKALRLANSERQSTTLGELVNLMQVDAAKIEAFLLTIHVLWDGVFQVCGYIAILYTLIGPSCFAGLGVMILAGPIQVKVMGKLFGMNRLMVKYTDARVKSTNEALQGIQCVKMYTWEDAFKNEIRKSRNEELSTLRSVSYLRGFSRAYMGAVPGLVAVTAFVVFSQSNQISASTLFAALVAFEQLRFPLLFYPMALAQLAQAKVSAIRLENFLRMREIADDENIGGGNYFRHKNNNEKQAEISLKDATIYWRDPAVPLEGSTFDEDKSSRTSRDDDATQEEIESSAERFPKPILRNVSFRVAPGELCAVVGRVGSGKSTLCSAILNETILNSGEISLKGNVAYAAQIPWILNATLRDNILFGLPMDEKKYERVIQVCQLEHDLDMLEHGDQTEIGERGINLSGGQKQRVSIARAAYADSEIIILDDPLSALDPEVGGKLFRECIVDYMKGKTRLFVTNQLQFLAQCDTIVALGKGKVIEQGTFSHLNSVEGGEVNRLLKDASTAKKPAEDVEDEEGINEAETTPNDTTTSMEGKETSEVKKGDGGLLTKEERNVGAVSFSVYLKYLKAGGGFLKFAVVYTSFVLGAANSLATNSWISVWTTDSMYENHSQAFYLGIYATLAVTLGIVTCIRAFVLARFGVKASQTLHENVLQSVLNAPQRFFDTTPVGRIISRFSKDIYSIDIELADFLDIFLFMSLNIVVSIGTILYATPWFGLGVIPLGILYFRFMNYFRNVSRETKRLESISRSPVFSVFSETLGGLTTIRAYDEQKRFADVFEDKVDLNTLATYNNKTADRWLAIRLELIGASIAGIAAVLAVQTAISSAGSNSNFASLAGLSLNFAITITGMLQFCVRTFSQLEAGMNACERVLHYTENIPQEAPSTSEGLKTLAASSNTVTPENPSIFAVTAAGGKVDEFSSVWPEKGAITLSNLRMQYRSDTPLVLKGLNVSISGGERVGVVGRTGSGKSSLLLALLRLVEPMLTEEDRDSYNAPITIDGVDVLRIGLKDVRSRLGIIPQKPVLFSGTIRSNVDPFNQYSDEQIWKALSQCGMKKSVNEMPGMLDATVAEYGENLSAGMCQLLVLGRALLKQCRILLLDEATSSVDYETDEEIQRTIRESFSGSTVLTIAHRINTIMDSDKILVMNDGVVEEFATPEELLKDENSSFSEIVRHAKSQKE